MLANVLPFLLQWAITALSLWVASKLFRGLSFDSKSALWISALLLGLANAIVRPVLVFLTFPLTLLTFGLFLLVVNALVLLLVAALVRGFTLRGFWTAVWASLFVSILSLAIGALFEGDDPQMQIQMPSSGTWL